MEGIQTRDQVCLEESVFWNASSIFSSYCNVLGGAAKEYQDDTVFISGIPVHVTVEQIGDMFGSIGIIKVKKFSMQTVFG